MRITLIPRIVKNYFNVILRDKVNKFFLTKYPIDHKSKGIRHFLECTVGDLKAPEGVNHLSYSCMYLKKGEINWLDERIKERLHKGIPIHQAMLQILEEQR